MRIFGYDINIGKAQNADSNLSPKAYLPGKITVPNSLFRTRQDIERWRSALQSAESPLFPNRTELYRLYKDLVFDAHVHACIQTRKNQILQSEFKVVDLSGNVNEEKTKLLQNKWFYDFISYSLDSMYWGHSLIQFLSLRNNVFDGVELVQREFVKPEFDIVTSSIGATQGTNYLDAPYNKWCIPVGDKRDLGMLAKIAPYVLWKKVAMGSWAEFNEMFGTPIRIGKTNTRDETTRSQMEGMLKNMGASAWGVFDTNDLIELIESNRSDAHQVFNELINMCNREISKLILGQTGTTDEKSFAGSAEVHERILHMYGEADEQYIKSVLKYQLIPLLNMHGMGFENMCIEIEEEDKFSPLEKSKIDLELLKYYNIDPKYIEEKYGVPVTEKVDNSGTVDSVKNKLDKYYS